LITIDSEHLGIPETQYGSEISMSSSEFNRICKELYQLSESVAIETNKQYIKFSVTGEVVGGTIKLEANDTDSKDDMISIKVDESVNLMFALRYLNMFTKASSLSDHVNLFLSSEYPLMVEYKLKDLGNLRFFLAPRINENEN
jgi:proliferating cell nuclear antigen